MSAKKKSRKSSVTEGYADQRMQNAVVSANLNYTRLMGKYGYLIGDAKRSRQVLDVAKAVLVGVFLLLPLLTFWCFIVGNLFMYWCMSFKFQTYSLSEYFSLFLGHCRLHLSQFENKETIQWNLLNRIVGFPQLLEFMYFTQQGKVLTLIERYKSLFSNFRRDSEAYPFLFSIVTTRYDVAFELIHKPDYIPTQNNDKDPIFCDREGKTVFMNESGSFFPMVGIPAVLSIADGRHDIGRHVVYLMLGVRSRDDYMDFKKYYQSKFRALPDDTQQWLEKYLAYPALKKSFNGIYFALTFYRLFGYKMTNKEIDYINVKWPLIAASALPDWFVFLLGSDAIPRNCFIAIQWMSHIMKSKCKHSKVTQNLLNYSKKMGFKNDNIVFYIAALSLFLAGGNLLVEDCVKRFELNPKSEYHKFMSHKDLYVKESYRANAAMVKAVSQLSCKPYTFRMHDKSISFPARTIVAVSLVHINDSLPGYKADQHIVPRPSRRGPTESNIYKDQLTFNLKDEYFFNTYEHDKLFESQRFCPGRIFIDPHLEEVFELVFQSLKSTYKIK